MVDKIGKDEFIQAWQRVLERLIESADSLNQLDAAAGDGDLGVTVTLGSKAVLKMLPDVSGQDIGTIVARSGMAFNTSASSTFGALFAIGSMRAGKEAKGAEEVDLPLLARMTRAAETGIKEKGKAERGDKTLLDALGPVADVLEEAASNGKSLDVAVREAVEAARKGVEATTGMMAKSGRSAWIAERTAGRTDPGATAVLVIWEAISEYLSAG